MRRTTTGPALGHAWKGAAILLVVACVFAVAGGVPADGAGARVPDGQRKIPASPTTAPAVYLWAWERATDLRAFDPARAGVAMLAGSVWLRADEVVMRPRLQPLRLPPGTWITAVVRIEVDPSSPPTRSAAQCERTVAAILSLLEDQPEITALQIDFDAAVAMRPFYTRLVSDLRRQMKPSWELSITALASWCLGDPWIAALPIDDAVPMLFRMGPDAGHVRGWLEQGKDFTLPVCRHSLGVSVDEPLAARPAGRRLYVFNPRGWTRESAARAVSEYAR